MPFSKGESGNPGGRPKTAALSKAARDVADAPFPRELAKKHPTLFHPLLLASLPAKATYAQAVMQNLALRGAGLKDPTFAAKEFADRAEGKARQAIDLGLNPEQFEGESKEALVDLILEALSRRAPGK